MKWLCFALLCIPLTCHAQVGSIDTNFSASFNAYVLKLQTDNKILAGGGTGLVRLNTNGSLDTNFSCIVTGSVWCVDIQDDEKILIGGRFSNVNGTPRSNFARLNTDGSLDTNFLTGDIGPVANAQVFAVLAQPDGPVLIGGSFATIGGVTRRGIARLNANGSLDPFFGSASGVDGVGICCEVRSMASQPDGKVIIGGSLTSINGIARNNIARLNSDGGLDNTFTPQPGPDSVVTSIALQPDGKLVIGGVFTSVDNVSNIRIARLNPNGMVDTNFNTGSGASALLGGMPVWSVACRQNGDVFLAGGFSRMDGVQRNGLAKLHSNGTLDTDFVPQLPPGSRGYSVVVQPDGNVLFAAEAGTVYRLVNFPPSTGPASVSVAMYPGLMVQGTVGGRYRIEYVNDLNSTNWIFLKDLILPSSPYLFFDVTALGLSQRFYRAFPNL